MTTEALNARLDRARKAHLKELFGTDDPAEIEKIKKGAADAEARRLADMSEVERAKAEAASEKALKEAATAELARERFNGTVTRACASLGVKNLDYATFEIDRATKALPAGQVLDVETHLKGLLAKPTAAAALGLEVEQVTAPVTTTPAAPGTPPPAPPPAGGNPPEPFDAMKADQAAWEARKEQLGVQ